MNSSDDRGAHALSALKRLSMQDKPSRLTTIITLAKYAGFFATTATIGSSEDTETENYSVESQIT